MARIRTIKPEFWTNEELAETSEPARLLAIGLLNHSDDEGYFKAHKSLIKAVVFPLTEPSLSIHECLKQLSKVGYIRLFTGKDGKEYGKVINFELHQRVNRPTESKIKKLDTFTECSLKDHGGLTEDSPPEGKGKEQGKEHDIKSGASAEPSELPVFNLPTNKYNTSGESYLITQSQIDEWADAFPACNVMGELKQMKVWLDANKSKRKTHGGMGKFVANWLSRTQNNGGSKSEGKSNPLSDSPTRSQLEELKRNLGMR